MYSSCVLLDSDSRGDRLDPIVNLITDAKDHSPL